MNGHEDTLAFLGDLRVFAVSKHHGATFIPLSAYTAQIAYTIRRCLVIKLAYVILFSTGN